MIAKIAAHMLEGIYVDRPGLRRVQELCKGRKTRIILLPMFKSFADPLVLLYVNYFFNMELGFSFGNYEDSPKIHFVEALFRRIGHFLIKRREYSNLSVNYVNQALIQEVVESNLVTTIYQNDERPRSGKFNLPMYPDNMIKLILKSYLGLKKYQYDIKLVPVCIEYDRIFDSKYLSTEIQRGLFAPGTKMINVM
jgi:glycerol-3-phosphate O-acyltransferase